MKIINKYIFTMTVISSLVVICIYYLPQPLQFPENPAVRVEERQRDLRPKSEWRIAMWI